LFDQLVGLDERGQQLTGFCDRVSACQFWRLQAAAAFFYYCSLLATWVTVTGRTADCRQSCRVDWLL
jgi:hypothetical protein